MRLAIRALLVVSVGLGAGVSWANSPATQPAPAPGTPGSVPAAITGSVVIGGDSVLEKPVLTRTVVYLASNPVLDSQPAAPTHTEVRQIHKSFQPNFLAIRIGTVVDFPNWDHISHNVFSRSAAAPAFDLERYPYGQSKTRQFTKVGIVQLFCNIHPSMRAVIYVTPNAHFAVPDETGRFSLRNIPPGKYELVAWNDRCKEWRRTIELKAAQTSEVGVTLLASSEEALVNAGPLRPQTYGVAAGLGVKREVLGLPVVRDVHPATMPADLATQPPDQDAP